MKKIVSRILFSIIFCFGLLITFMLNPNLLYGHSTTYKNVTIYHNGELNQGLKQIIDLSLHTIQDCEIYSTDLRSELCLNEGIYPFIIKGILGDDVFTAFSNKIVVLGEESIEFNQFEKWGKTMNYSQFLTHALVHNLQFKRHGLWDSNPLGGHSLWKWEGYVEFVVLGELISLAELVEIISDSDIGDFEWVYLRNKKGTLKRHLNYLALVKYCFEVLEWDYDKLMESQVKEEVLFKELNAYIKK